MPVTKLAAYPKDIFLRDGAKVTIKPMVKADKDALLKFFLRVPEEDRFYLKEDVTSPKIIQEWCDHLDYDRALPLLAWVNGEVVANGLLLRRRAGARRHVGELRIVVDPAYRKRGLGTTVLHELILIANEHGLERLLIEIVSDRETDALEAAERLGFVKAATLVNHVKDIKGKPQDLVIVEMPLGKWLQWWEF